jgi:intein/homing endonuclease/phage terminase large subunit-like protein
MKPVWEGSLVTMLGGDRIPLRDVKIGDYVLTHTGNYQPVEGVAIQGDLECLRITTHSGREALSALDHPFLTPEGWVQAQNLREGQSLALVTPTRDVVAEEDPQLIHFARLAGYLIGDGGITVSCNFTCFDDATAEDFCKTVEQCGFTWKLSAVKGRYLVQGAMPWLRAEGLSGLNSHTKFVPNFVLRGGRQTAAAFIAAYFACDGCNKKSKSRRDACGSFTSVSHQLLDGVRHLLIKIGINSRIRTRIHNKNSWVPVGYVFYALELCDRDGTKFESHLTADPIVKIETVGKLPCRCLSVKTDHSFTIQDIAVHNSLLVSVFWPAWEWGPRNRPGESFMSVAHTSTLSQRDLHKSRLLIDSTWYQMRWGHRFAWLKDQCTLTRARNDRGGFRLATSKGAALGEGATRLCLPYETLITTDRGQIPIGLIVEEKLDVKVLGPSGTWQKIAAYFKSPGQPLIEIKTDDGACIRPTENHPVHVVGRGSVSARDLLVEEKLLSLQNGTLSIPNESKDPIPTQTCIESQVLYGTMFQSCPDPRREEWSGLGCNRKAGEGEVRVRIVSIRSYPAPDFVYNINTEHDHKYYADRILVSNCFDDLTNAVAVQSQLQREADWRWYRDTFMLRDASPTTSVRVCIGQRLHEDEIYGRMLAEEKGWNHLRLPMAYEPWNKCITSIGEDWRIEEGQPLWPERFGDEQTAREYAKMWEEGDPYVFSAQGQQNPTPVGGAIFVNDNFIRYDHLPTHLGVPYVYSSWDLATEGLELGAACAGLLLAYYPQANRYYILDERHFRKEFPYQCEAIKDLASVIPEAQAHVVEKQSNGAAAIATLSDVVKGIQPFSTGGLGSKQQKWRAIAPRVRAGNVYVPDENWAPWIKLWLKEICSAPFGTQCDRTDAFANAILWNELDNHASGGIRKMQVGAPSVAGFLSERSSSIFHPSGFLR